jgi:membrane dipeptidase
VLGNIPEEKCKLQVKPTPIFDGHNDTLTKLDRETPNAVSAFLDGNNLSHIDLPRAQIGGLVGGFFAIFVPPSENSPERDPLYGVQFTSDGYITSERSPLSQGYAETFTDRMLRIASQLEDASHHRVAVIRDYLQLEQCIDKGIFAVVLHLEGAEAIAPTLENLEKYYAMGVRSIGIVWSRPNSFGYGVPFRFPHTPEIGLSLTAAGRSLIKRCNELGILIDLAHMNADGFRQAAQLSTKPLVVTHADVHAICPSTRNLLDWQIDAIAASNGVIGINFETLNTHPRSDIARDVPLTQITAHIHYIIERVGIDHVAFGSDLDGAEMPVDLSDASKMQGLVNLLREQGLSSAEIDQIALKNWMRVFRTTWG